MTTSTAPETKQAADDEFGAGVFEEPAAKRAPVPVAAPEPKRAPPPAAVAPTKPAVDEDDGFGAGLL